MQIIYEIHKVTRDNREYIGKTPIKEQAVKAAKAGAKESRCIYEVTMISECVGIRTVAYHSDGSVEKLW